MDACADTQQSEYIGIAVSLVRNIWGYSPQAAECIEQIYAHFGPRSAYLAAFAIMLLKQTRRERTYPPTKRDLHSFTYYDEMQDKPDAIRLYETAASHLLLEIQDTDTPGSRLYC